MGATADRSGFRFAVPEIKCVLFALFRNIECSLLSSKPVIFHNMAYCMFVKVLRH